MANNGFSVADLYKKRGMEMSESAKKLQSWDGNTSKYAGMTPSYMTKNAESTSGGGFSVADLYAKRGVTPSTSSLSVIASGDSTIGRYNSKITDASNRYNSLLSRLNNAIESYGKDYGTSKSNSKSVANSRNEFASIRNDIQAMLDELGDYNLYATREEEFKNALDELLKATDSASLDARSRIAAYNNPATQSLMKANDNAAYSLMLNEKLQNSPQMALYNSMLDAMGGEDKATAASTAPYFWQFEESPVRQDQLLGELTQRYSNIANQYPRGTDTRDKYLGLATDTQNTRDQLSAYRSALVAATEDEQLNREIERLKAIDIDTAISTVQQTIDEKDAKVQTMSKYWDEQAWMNDENAEAPDYEEYQRELAELEKYQLILDRLYADKDAERASPYTVLDSEIKANFGHTYNPSRLFDRINESLYEDPYAGDAIDYGLDKYVEANMSDDVKTSSYPIAQRPEHYMTQEERDTYNTLYFREGEESANAYFERIKPVLEARGAQQVMAEAKQFTEDYPNWAGAQARGANAMKPITSAFMIGDILSGNGINENSAANLNTSVANFVDSYVPQVTNYTGDAQILGRDLDQFLYGTVGSVIDSGVRTLTASFLSGGGSGATLRENIKGLSRATGALMSLEVFPTVVLQEKEKGRSDTEAVVLGTLRAAIEGLTEKYSIEMLFSPSRNFGTQLLKGAVAEGSEEIAATVLNGAVDIIAGDKDNIIAEFERRVAMGINPSEALADILLERGKSTLVDGLSGALSGLLFTAGGGAAGAFETSSEAKTASQTIEGAKALVEQVLAENPNNKVALNAQKQLASGKNISARTAQKLINANEDVALKNDQQKVTEAVIKELTNRGEVTAVRETAAAIAKAVSGENLSDGELRSIEGSVFGTQIYNEITGKAEGGEWLNQLREDLDILKIAPQTKKQEPRAKRVTVRNADATTKSGERVQILGLQAQDDGTVSVKVRGTNGAESVVAASELNMSEESQDLVEGVAEFKGAAPAVYAAYMPTNDISAYLNDAEFVVEAARGVVAENDGSAMLRYLKNSRHISELADIQIETIFNAALADGRKALAEAQPLSTAGSGQFTYTAKRAESSLRGREAASTVFMQNLAKAAPNIDIEVFESTARNGKYIGEQGSYSNGKIRIDLNAGKNFTYEVAESAMIRTLSHELTHHLQRTAPKQYADLKAFVIKHLAEWNGGKELDDLISAKQRRSRDGLSYAAAMDEVVADSCEMMLKNSKAIQQLATENKSLFAKIRDFVKKFLSDLRRAFAGVEATDAAAKYLQKFESEMQQLWDAAFTASVENAKNAQASAVAEKMGVAIDAKTDSVTPTVFSERTWRSSDYVQSRDKAAAEIAKAIGVSVQQAKDYIDDINSIARMISEDRNRLDYFSSPMRSSFISNAEYGGSFDFSTLCKKRRLLTGTFTAIQKALPNTALTANEILDIRNKMKEAGLEVSCGLCYVEGSRANMGQFAKEFLRLYKQYYPTAWQPNMADVNTPDGIEWVRINHPECYEQYEYFWNHYGTLKPGDKNLFASQQKPKLYQLHTEYNGEVLLNFKGDAKIEEKNKNGGVRLQSFSDFEIVHLIDCMQIIMDMSRVGLAGQAYTKVPEFAWALGDTGLKINLSLIAKDVDANGKLIFDDVEGMPINTAMEIRNRYSANVGTILVVFNDAQLTAAMADERVDFIIPFHRSQWKKSQYAAMGLPAKTKDYTYQQNEKYIKPQYHEYRGRMVRDKATNYMPNEYWDFSKSGKENAIAYLEMCAANNKRPKFYKLLQNNGDGSYSLKADGSTDGYWKLLIDFKMYDNEGNGSPQMPVQPKFNMEQATKMLNEYKGGHSQFPVAQGIVDEFVSNYKATHGEQKQYSERDIYVQTLTEQDIERYYNTGKTGHVRNKKMRIRDSGGSAVLTSESEVHEFVENSVLFGTTEIKGYGVVPLALSDKILEGTEGRTNTESWFLELSSDDLFHAFREHENAKEDGDLDMSVEEFARIPMSINGKADYLGFERYKDQTKIKLGVRDENGGNFVVVEMVSSGSYALRLKNAWKVTYEKYEALKERKASTEHKWTSKMPAPSNGRGLSDSNIAHSAAESQEQKSDRDYEAAEIARLEQRIEALEQGKADAFLAGQMRTARQAGKETRRLEEKINTLKGKLDAAKQTAMDTRKATAAERKAADLRAKNLEAQIKKLTKEAEASGFLAGEMSVARQAGAEIRNREEQIRKLKAELADRKAAYSANLAKFREGRDTGTYRERVMKRIRDMQDMLITNSDKKHIPEILKEPLGNFLMSLDTSSATKLKGKGETKRDVEMIQRTAQLKDALNKARNATGAGGYLDISDEFIDKQFEEMVTAINSIYAGMDVAGTDPITLMSAAQLKNLNFVLRTLQKSISDMNKLMATARFHTVAEAAESTITELDQILEYQMKGKGAEALHGTINWKNTTPVYAFDRMGEAGKELFKAMWEAQGEFAFHTSEILETREGIVSNKQVREWSQDVQTIQLSDNRSIRMTTAQMMAFYCLTKRQKALDHLKTGGIRISNIEYGRNHIQQARAYHLSADDIVKIANMVKGDAKRVADQLQQYMTERGSEWGNQISMARFGYRAFTEPVYFPIRTESSQIAKDTKSTQENSINRLLNMSFTKSTQPNASTSVVVDNIFDVFSAHMSDMAKYNAFALPVLDMIKWFDYNVQERLEDGVQKDHRAVKTSIESAYGKDALNYISTFLEDVNGANEGGRVRSASLSQKFISHYKASAVGANLRVAIQQPTSYWRAAAVLDPKYLAVGEKVMWHNAKKYYKEMSKYAGIATWKELGFRDFNVGRSVREQIAGTLSASAQAYDKVMDASMKLAALGDTWTWCRIWEACKAEVKATQKLSGEELMHATADRFNEVIARTQVVDSIMTRSHTMRSKNLLDQLMTPFMAEPTLSYNVVASSVFDYRTEIRKSNKQDAWKKHGKKIARAFGVFTATAFWTGVFQSLADALRDDDDYEEFYKKFLDAMLPRGLPKGKFNEDPIKWIEEALDQGNFLANMNIASNIPGLHRELLNVLKGFGSEAMWTAGISNLYNAVAAVYEKISLEAGWMEEATDVTWNGNMTWWGAIQKSLQSASQISSLPIYNLLRDATALYNTTVQEFFGRQDIKLLSYDPGTEGRVANAYADGFLTFDEAMGEMLKFGVSQDKAYETLMKSAGFGKYDELREAIVNGGDVNAVMEKLTGYGIKEDLVTNNVKAIIKDLVLGTEDEPPMIDKKTAKNLLIQYLGMTVPEAHYTVEAYGEENFSKYDDLRDAILNGGDVQAAMDELTEYGTKESDVLSEIRASIKVWYQGETKDDGTVVEPVIDKDRAVELLVQYGDRDEDEATELVTEWSLTVDTGVKDIKEAFIAGDLTTDEAIDYRMTYYGQSEEDAAQTVAEWIFEDEYGFSYNDRIGQFKDGNLSADELVDVMVEYGGKTDAEAKASVAGYAKEAYADGQFTRDEALSVMTNSGGMTSDEADKRLRYIDVSAQFPDITVDDAWVNEYYEEVESSGISINVFIEYRNNVKDISGEGKKARRMDVINSMPISNAQKDALYYAEGWAASTIHEAPWR